MKSFVTNPSKQTRLASSPVVVYASIGNSNQSNRTLWKELEANGLRSSTIVVSSQGEFAELFHASRRTPQALLLNLPEKSSLAEQYLIPFAATHLANELLEQGRRVLLVLDSLSVHFDITRRYAAMPLHHPLVSHYGTHGRVYGISWSNAAAAPTRHAEIFDLADYYKLAGLKAPLSSLTVLGIADTPPSGDSSLTVDNQKQRGHVAQVSK